MAKHGENTQTGRILFTLGKEYDNLKDVWDTIPTSTQTVNLLIEKLFAIELQADKLALAETTALVTHEDDKKKLNYMKVNSSKSMKRGADCAKHTFPCNKCKRLGHWSAERPQKQQYARDRGGKSTAKKNADAFPVHVMGASRASSVNVNTWYCDSGATRHTMLNEHYFVSYTKFANPETIMLGKKNVLMQAYDKHPDDSQWHDATLKNVWYVPDACAHLFSVKAPAQNGYSTTLNEK